MPLLLILVFIRFYRLGGAYLLDDEARIVAFVDHSWSVLGAEFGSFLFCFTRWRRRDL